MQGIKEFPDFVRGLPELDLPIAGARGWLLQGEDQQLVFVEFAETVEVPEHSHGEQWEWVVAGRVTLHREGRSEAFGQGENFFIPAGMSHGATVQAGYKALIVFNERDRYKPKA